MTLSPGRRFGPYEILSSLGAGGMGEVYRARDTRLNRTVAIKILPQHLSAQSEVRQRFEREAMALSKVSHPHICAVYDVGMEGEAQYLVMEYLEGETLAHHVARGALPLSQTLRIGMQIAEALSVAHRQGIVHRDLKPSNVMLTASGAKLLDFGLAKAVAGPAAHSSQSALTTHRVLTQEGTILGTVPYMAPEQLEGKETDARTDIFALGAVVYEMATGRRAFNGTSRASLISAIMKDTPPPIATHQPLCPRSLDRAVEVCLAKNPEDRWQSARDVAHALGSVAESPGSAASDAPARAGRARERIAWSAFSIAALAALLCAALLLRPESKPATVFTSSILPPENHRFDFDQSSPAVSPDGKRIAFVARPAEGPGLLWVRSFDASVANPLSGTEDARAPFWSPDSRSLGFFAAGKLRRLDLSGGAPKTLCDAPFGGGGSWSQDGTIIFVPSRGGPVHRVASTGGESSPVTSFDPKVDLSHFAPVFLPDGRHFLYQNYSLGSRKAEVLAGALDSEDRHLVIPSRANVAFAPAAAGSSRGLLLFLKDRVLMAQPFDAERLQLVGDSTPIADQVAFNPVTGFAAFSTSQNGVLAYQTSASASSLSNLVWIDRDGKRLETIISGGAHNHPRLSHDGKRVAYVVEDPQNALADIWILDLARRSSTRLTFGPAVSVFPVWSPDDQRIVFSSNRNGAHEIFQRATSGAGEEEMLISGGRSRFATDYSPAGIIALQSWDTAGTPSGLDVQVFSQVDENLSTLMATSFREYQPQFSPDGRWLAYVTDESGRREVYVRLLSAHGTRTQVSTTGGICPRWSRDGRELFYIAPDHTLMTADVAVGPEFRVGMPRPLFHAEFKLVDIGYPYDVSPDGKRFLVNELVEGAHPDPITVVQYWTARLR